MTKLRRIREVYTVQRSSKEGLMSEQQLALMRMPLGPLGTNCYVIGDKAIGEAFIIDPATAEVLDALKT